MLGICGQSDMRSVIQLRSQGDARAALALDMFVFRVRKYIGAYMAVLGGKVDALVFSAGIGENSADVRRMVCEGLQVGTY
jgi:acetate kinase